MACTEAPEPQGFAGLAESVGQDGPHEYLQPAPGDTLTFPGDLGPHPQHRIEWWYLTANLRTADGQPLGVQWTQFRQALKPRPASAPAPAPEQWPLESAWMAHAAVSLDGEHRFSERLARGDVGHAGAVASPFEVWLDDWWLRQKESSDDWHLTVDANDWAYDLRLANTDKRVTHGDDGFSAKSHDGKGSMYFSLTNLEITGTVTLDGTTYEVQGQGWFDREWSSQFLKAGQQGWDWFALHLEGGHKLMALRLREDQGDFLSGTWVRPDGTATSLAPDQIELAGQRWHESEQGRVPRSFNLTIPALGVDLSITAPRGDYWNAGLYPYWESPVSVSGSHSGVGYMELTGYGSQ
ncbi:lipocalin-like domain-containing protein [Marinobacter sp. CHS3-4]|nr:lipocalin-like domain-containing protein [Marinobacter sp. CHS3-4]MDI9246308.1 lipocalin-like domain-containing protein [Marinobacter sp. CHS3-4]